MKPVKVLLSLVLSVLLLSHAQSFASGGTSIASILPDSKTQDKPVSSSFNHTVTVKQGESVYSYHDMTVFNDGGTVYNSLGIVFNNYGIVYNNGGIVFNNGGTVYADSGTVFLNGGTVYNNDAKIITSDEPVEENGIVYGYYELKLADYYAPYVDLEGTTTEPGSEKMIISEDTVCRITPHPGYCIENADATVGRISMESDGSVILTDVNSDTILTLEIIPKH